MYVFIYLKGQERKSGDKTNVTNQRLNFMLYFYHKEHLMWHEGKNQRLFYFHVFITE